ncbi:MAG: hypothetical protein OIF50_10220 [Flavobacteriaceae bacterium]|nr:hypothetical protein [Flavobacteriaceae bacterium]
MSTTAVLDQVKLIDGEFSASEASDLIQSLIKQKINFHKVHRLSMYEGNMGNDTSVDDSRIQQLITAQQEFKNITTQARESGKKIKISGVLDIEILN